MTGCTRSRWVCLNFIHWAGICRALCTLRIAWLASCTHSINKIHNRFLWYANWNSELNFVMFSCTFYESITETCIINWSIGPFLTSNSYVSKSMSIQKQMNGLNWVYFAMWDLVEEKGLIQLVSLGEIQRKIQRKIPSILRQISPISDN